MRADERIRGDFLRTGDWARALAERSAAVDALSAEAAQRTFPPDARPALLAVGGYGRRELFPCSDVDLLLLFANDRDLAAAREPMAQFLQALWDSGLRVSQSVRTVAECAELHNGNLELTISLLDRRFLWGDAAPFAALEARLPRLVHAERDEIGRRLARLTRDRHGKYQDTYYHLEPDIKDGPGGLRDLHLVRWLQQVRGGVASLPEELHAAHHFLARLRCLLHCLAGRDSNALTFECQESAASHWGEREPAAWMRQYFRHARAISRQAARSLDSVEGKSSALLAGFRDWRARLSNAEFTVSRERVYLRTPQQLEHDPMLLVRLFHFVARHGVWPAPETADRIAARLPQLSEWFAEPRPLWPALAEWFTLPNAPLALRAMHETGAGAAIFPEWAAVECLVVRDFFHRYTVDEHSLVAIQNLFRIREPLAELWSELEHPAALVFALLLHDVGKASGEPHVTASLRAAGQAMERIGMPPEDREMTAFLIREHLAMPALLRSRDISDPATIREMAARAGTVERLKALTLASYADVSAVNPAAMTPWRAEQLWELYVLTYNELTRELEADRISGDSPFFEGFPTRYLRTHSRDELDAHLELERRRCARGVAADVRRLNSVWRLTLVARDRPYLFASVAGALSSFGMNILKAEAFANRSGVVLDTFTFSDPNRTLELNPTEVDRLRLTVERVLLGKVEVRELLRNRPRPRPPSANARVRPRVGFDNDASPGATLIHVVAEDRPGLLYDLAAAMSSQDCNIEVVLVDTEAHKAFDVFYVTCGGGKLPADRCETLQKALMRCCRV